MNTTVSRPIGLLTAVTGALLLSSCSGSPATTDPSSSGEAVATHTIETEMGDVVVPVDPQRIVSIDYRAATQVLAELDAPLVGTQTRTDGAWEALGEDIADLPSVWVRGAEIDMEAIIELQPDLIVGAVEDNADLYEQLSEIAPTVLISSEPSWTEVVEFAGEFTNRGDEAERILAEVDDRVAEVEDAIAERWPDGVDVTLLRVRDDLRSTQVADRNNRSAPWLLNQIAGITVTGDARDVENDRLSPEQLREADGDVILYFPGGGGAAAEEDATFLGNVHDNPLWDDLGAVQAGRAALVDSDVWFDGAGVTALGLAADDLLEYVAGAPR